MTSVDELLQGLSMNAKLSATPASSGEPPYTPPAEGLPTDPEDGGTTLCTLINKVSNLKFANSSGLLGIKSLPSAVKDLAVSKLQGGGGGSGNPGPLAPSTATGTGSCGSASTGAPCSQQDIATMSAGKKGRLEDMQQGGEDWNPSAGGLVNKPPKGWLHSSEKISGPGVTYIVKVSLFSLCYSPFFCLSLLLFVRLIFLRGKNNGKMRV